MNETTTRPADFSRALDSNGINGSGQKVWAVITTWTDSNDRKRSHVESFTSEAEARNWMKWA